MRIISVRNVHDALPLGLRLLREEGVQRSSRGGDVLVAPFPVATVYERPFERVIFWPQRDANPFLHLYESLWILAGRSDVTQLARYARQYLEYSDDGETLHDAYGRRLRSWFGVDQFDVAICALRQNHDDRRVVLQLWDARDDLGRAGRAVPCNLAATLQIDTDDRLNLVVFCRSNDIVWGAYGANAPAFSTVLEYVATRVGVAAGTYTQISVNYHGYLETLRPIIDEIPIQSRFYPANPYDTIVSLPMPIYDNLQTEISDVVASLSLDPVSECPWIRDLSPGSWTRVVYETLRAHAVYRSSATPEKYDRALEILGRLPRDVDWVVAAREWIERRRERWELRMARETETLGEA